MNDFRKHRAEWKKQDKEKEIRYNSIHIKFKNRQYYTLVLPDKFVFIFGKEEGNRIWEELVMFYFLNWVLVMWVNWVMW